jgi:hypothetical protein
MKFSRVYPLLVQKAEKKDLRPVVWKDVQKAVLRAKQK